MSRMDATAKREAWNRREVAEWIGATPDSKVPDHVRQRVFLRHHGMCHIAKRKIRAAEPWDLDHVIALRDWTGEGHGNRESNLAPALKDKHRAKTAEEATARATVNRKQAKHIGSASSKRAFWDPKRKRTVSGRVVER